MATRIDEHTIANADAKGEQLVLDGDPDVDGVNVLGSAKTKADAGTILGIGPNDPHCQVVKEKRELEDPHESKTTLRDVFFPEFGSFGDGSDKEETPDEEESE